MQFDSIDTSVLCHTCGTIESADNRLTFEHAPPLRVQKLINSSKYRRTNPIGLLNDRNRNNRLPPCSVYRAGLGRDTLCESCQQLTQTHYGAAFYEWSLQALRVAERVNPDESYADFSFEIKPLLVIKQILTSLLAVGDFDLSRDGIRLRAFLQKPSMSMDISPFSVFTYLNPPDPRYELAQSRLSGMQMQMCVDGKDQSVACPAEVAYPPMGYVLVWQDATVGLSREVKGLTEITHFSTYPVGHVLRAQIRLAVRTPFGPMSLRYWQTAKQES